MEGAHEGGRRPFKEGSDLAERSGAGLSGFTRQLPPVVVAPLPKRSPAQAASCASSVRTCRRMGSPSARCKRSAWCHWRWCRLRKNTTFSGSR